MAEPSLPIPGFKVLPWNGLKSALSLTFDDGNPVHVDFVVPELAKRGLRATFYVMAGLLEHPERWMGILGSGQEIGNHSLDHPRAAGLSPGQEQLQTGGARKKLEDLFGRPIHSFAYPYAEITPTLRKAVGASHLLGRGGNRSAFYMKPDSEPDFLDIPSQVLLTDTPYEIYQDWVEENQKQGSWTVLQLHGIEGAATGWQPMRLKDFHRLMDLLVASQKETWVAPFSDIGAYWLAQKTLEKSVPLQEEGKTILAWEKPSHFPTGMRLKFNLGRSLRASQYGKTLEPGTNGLHILDFDAKDITLESV